MEKRIAFLTVIFMAVSACSSIALALPPMGPPEAILGENQWAVDVRYAYQEMQLDSFGKVRENLGLGWLPCDYTKYKIEDLASNIFLGGLGYGISDYWDVFVYAGLADAKDEIAEALGCGRSGYRYYGFGGNYQSAWGFGTRATFCLKDNLALGGLFQMTWSDIDSSDLKLRGDPNFIGDIELGFWEIQVAVGPTLHLKDISIYGGPFFHFVKGDMDLKGSTVDFGVTQLVESSADIREESSYGGYGGIRWGIAEKVCLYTECQFTGDAWSIGTGADWKF